jgi:DNA polymerase-4
VSDAAAAASAARRILLLDCDQFFVQCARIADPEGAGHERLLLVGGTAQGRGVVTSASYETRKFGVRSGMPTAQALRLCPAARVVPVPRSLCVEKSRDIRRVLDEFAPVVEPASIDEAYIDLSGTEALYRGEDLDGTARRIQEAVLARTTIHVSIGGGTTKLVAKLAATRAKPAGVHIVAAGGEVEFMRAFRLEDIPGVGPVFATRLRALGLVAVDDALRLDRDTLVRWIPGRGGWLHARIRGEDAGTVRPDRDARSMSREETFPHDIADFTTRTAARTLPAGVRSDRVLFSTAQALLRQLRDRRAGPLRLIGVAASHFAPPAEQQLSLPGTDAALESERDLRLAHATDTLRSRFGPDAVLPARLIQRPPLP